MTDDSDQQSGGPDLLIASFRDPDGNHISLIEYPPEHW